MSPLRRRLLLALVFLDVLVLYLARFDTHGRVHLWFLPDAGGLIVVAPDGEAILIDGGADATALAEELGARLPPVWGRLGLAVLTRSDVAALAAHGEVFRHFSPRLAWRPPLKDPGSAAVVWEDHAGDTDVLSEGLQQEVGGIRVHVVAMAPPALRVEVGALGLVYAPAATWEHEEPPYARPAVAWLIAGIQQERSDAFLPPLVILPALSRARFDALAPTILHHPHTTFFIGDGRSLHIITDGERYTVEVTGKRRGKSGR